jgi:hypothetical protein
MLFSHSTVARSMGNVEVRDKVYLVDGKFQEAVQAAAQVVGDYLQKKILEKITQQDPSWPPLADATVAAKGSTKAWIDTGEIFTLIADRGLRIEEGPPIQIEVGIFDHEKAFVAMCLEYGTNGVNITARGINHTSNHIPERPLFRLVFDTEIETALSLFKDEINKRLPR